MREDDGNGGCGEVDVGGGWRSMWVGEGGVGVMRWVQVWGGGCISECNTLENGRTFKQYQSTSIFIISSQMSYTTECIAKLRTIIHNMDRQMSGASVTP